MEHGVFEMIAIALLIIVMQNNDDNDRFGASGNFFFTFLQYELLY